MAAYLALLDALAETLAGDPVAAERAVRDAAAMVAGSGDRWHQAMVNVELAHASSPRAATAPPRGRADRRRAGAVRCRMGHQAPRRARPGRRTGGRPRRGLGRRGRRWRWPSLAVLVKADA